MTVPHLMNCPHSDDGWCLDCVVRLSEENRVLRERVAVMEGTIRLVLQAMNEHREKTGTGWLYHDFPANRSAWYSGILATALEPKS